ncbi:PAS domain-containing protein [Candidatus Saccharibacteria bacterium]|nr:PAS domain-containing protein [Candidatus Saccharibacteria bacterium]
MLAIAVTVSGLYIWQRFGATNIDQQLLVTDLSGYLALATSAVALVSYFISTRALRSFTSFVPYILLLATTGSLVVLDEAQGSLSIVLWAVSAVFVSVFGTIAVVAVGVSTLAFTVYQYVNGLMGIGDATILLAATLLPLITGVLLWKAQGILDAAQTSEDKSYNELASELSQVASKSEVVINAITDGVLALDNKGTIRLINPAAQQIIGWGKHDAINLSYKSVLKLLNAKNTEVTDAEDPVVQTLNTNKPIKTEVLSVQTHSGKSFLASLSVSPVGQLGNGVIVVFRDITAERSDERQRAEFISTASHEMRTPVASIEGYLGLALNPQTAQIDAKARDFITKAHESAKHLGRLFQDLLDVSRADDGRLQNNPTIIDVVPFVHEIIQGLTPRATEKGLRIMYKPMPDGENDELSRRINPVYYVNVDADHLREVSDNLIENAIKYTPRGEVVVDIGGDDSHVVISIQDTGIGIPREDQAHLFQKFYRVDNSDTREIGGTGLGLYLCRRLTETMGGRIWAESEYKKGSTFFVELPRIDHEEATRLIEQASILAEQRAEAEAAQAASDAQSIQTAQIQSMATTNDFTSSVPTQTFAQPPETTAAPSPQTIQPAYNPNLQQNTPLSAIEANPSQYIGQQRPTNPGITIPPRQ